MPGVSCTEARTSSSGFIGSSLQRVTQHLARPSKVRSNRPLLAAQDPSDLVHGQAHAVVQDDRFLLTEGEPPHQSPQVDRLLRARIVTEGRPKQRPAPHPSSGDVEGRGHHPSADPSLGPEALPSLERPSERLLRRVLGEGSIVAQQVDCVEHRLRLRLVQALESRVGLHWASSALTSLGGALVQTATAAFFRVAVAAGLRHESPRT